MRHFSCILLVVSAVLFEPAAGFGAEGQAADDRVTLRVNVPNPSWTEVLNRSRRAVFEEYVRLHPHVRIETASSMVMEGAGSQTQLLAIAGGIQPEVVNLYYQHMHSYIEQDFLAPIDEYLETWHMRDKVPKQLWPVVMAEKTDKNGKKVTHYYGAISSWPTVYLVYNRDHFEEMGLDPDIPPKTWDELFDYAKRLSDPERRVETARDVLGDFGRMGLFLQTGTWAFSNFVWQAGGELVRQRPDGKWEAVFDSPEAVAALDFYRKMRWTKWELDGKEYEGVVRTGFGATHLASSRRTFAAGEVSMAFMAMSSIQDVLMANILRPEAIGVAPLPAGPTGIRASIVHGDAWCISSSIMNDKKKMDAAWEYIQFMTSDRAREIETGAYVEAGYARFVRNPYWLKEFGYDEYFDEIDPQTLAAFNDALKYGRPEPYCPSYSAMSIDMNIPISRALNNPNANSAEDLKKAVTRVNTFFFKLHPEVEMRFKRRVSLIIAVVVVVGVSIAGYMLVKSLQARVAASRSGLAMALKASRWRHIYAWAFLLPAVSTIFLWRYLPLARGSVMSFYDYKILGGGAFIGLDNFIEAVGQPIFWKSLYHTFFYTALTMTFGFATPIILALFLSEVPRFRITFRVLFYLPALTSALVLMFLWKDLLYNPTQHGILNQFIGWFGIPAQTWLQDKSLAMFCIVLPGVWAGAGPGSIIYLAALKTVPEELYEAAEMDGAGPIAKIRLVTLPFLKGLVIINFFGAFIGSFHATQNIFVMTMGGPEKATHTLSLEIFFNAFLYLKFGYATAMAWIMGAMLIGFTLYQLRIFQRLTFTAGAAREAKQA